MSAYLSRPLNRRGFIALGSGALLTLAGCASSDQSDPTTRGALPTLSPDKSTTLRIGVSTAQVQLAAEPSLGPLPFSVEWVRLNGGPETIQGFRAGAVDLAANAGMPPIQAHDIGVDAKIELSSPNKTDISHSYTISRIARTTCMSMQQFKDPNRGGKGLYPDLVYDRYILVDTSDKANLAILWDDSFTTNNECTTNHNDRPGGENAMPGQAADWKPDMASWNRAFTPSNDRTEIAIATEVMTLVTRGFNSQSPETPPLTNDNTSVGYDPVNGITYVWAEIGQWATAKQTEWSRTAAKLTCGKITERTKNMPNWSMKKYAIVIDFGNTEGGWQRWGSIGNCDSA
ncbi:hypothetical protein ACFXD5_24945 [Streptomyces sp. NPDC059385]|uniref:hypothetical protein n=1 Tax=Streptomyces sp. NPDC059385 TaxID=3346817 RepID=UPI0036BA32CB